MQKDKGFSLIELLIVVAIILIIAAISVPSLLRARLASNESAATNQLRTLNTAQVAYITAYSGAGFGTLAALGGSVPCTPSSATACLIDNSFATNYGGIGKDGYMYSVTLSNSNTNYDASAYPNAGTNGGINSFCSIEDGVIRKDSTGANDSTHDTCGGLAALGK